ncbi:GntR family transcriptional regulator [Streptomyces sp. SLBN-118]|uniref:GntR family transcriptional regulator n=1 Tax=Streptomyces sp. SLBN-118 TaxID=2768454 RepID=UPI001150C77C|nr:GntR family transcriptional regulator [Streptomyces sp. SLBN-118]TQK51968.1 GntR family transcriptional regulator [Streptomyces sp. SLBN-118]
MAQDAALRLSTVSVVEALAASLHDRVLDGQIPPGTTLAETEIANEYGVSRPTARSAITALVYEGLLHREANKAAYVPRLTRADVEDLFLIRTPLETEAVRVLVERGTVPVTAAERAITDLERLGDDAPHSAFVEPDLRFHQSLIDAVGSPRLSRLYRGIKGEVHLCMAQTQHTLGRERIVAEHGRTLEALQAADVDEAVGRMRAHLDGACRSLRRVFETEDASGRR